MLACICGETNGDLMTVHGVNVIRCSKCGIVRQQLERTENDLASWYRTEYQNTICTHTYEQDATVAKLRLTEYMGQNLVKAGVRLLDVGSGNGAFVDVCRSSNIKAYGCDFVQPNEWTYDAPLQQVRFPPCFFDIVTFHDSLEHISDPVDMLNEVQRILRPSGKLIIDFPRFHSCYGDHHWKTDEHLWMFKEKDLRHILERLGFVVDAVTVPIKSKLLFRVSKPQIKMTRILVPPGMGDIYWVLCKLESFIESHATGTPEVWIASLEPNLDRSFEYLDRHNFLYAAGYFDARSIKSRPARGRMEPPVWRRAYMEDNDGVFPDVLGFDYFLSANGGTRHGRSLDELMPGCATNWYPPMFISVEERTFGTSLRAKFGDYLMAYFVHHGMYKHWLKELPPSALYNILQRINQKTGMPIVLTGAGWDVGDPVGDYLISTDKASSGFIVDLRGKTTMPQLLSLLRASKGCIGFCGGNTIMSAAFKKPTVLLWNSYFDKRFWTNSCPPDSLHNWYEPADTKEPPEQITDKFLRVLDAVVSDVPRSANAQQSD
jgi:2-polyprenyl-3-methyl-5-hydroxy-6-metoxy-1,4-benzoquinol methylase